MNKNTRLLQQIYAMINIINIENTFTGSVSKSSIEDLEYFINKLKRFNKVV